MSARYYLLLVTFFVLVAAIAWPLGRYMARVFAGTNTFSRKIGGPIERVLYRAARVDPAREHTWKGYALAVLSVMGTAKVALALLVLGVPIIDTFWIIIRRVSSGRSPFSADRGHLHHRLLDLGLSHRQAVMVIYGLGVILAVAGLLLSGRGQISVFLIIVIAGGVLLFLLTRRAGQSLERASYPDEPVPPQLEAIRRAGEEIVGAEDDEVG